MANDDPLHPDRMTFTCPDEVRIAFGEAYDRLYRREEQLRKAAEQLAAAADRIDNEMTDPVFAEDSAITDDLVAAVAAYRTVRENETWARVVGVDSDFTRIEELEAGQERLREIGNVMAAYLSWTLPEAPGIENGPEKLNDEAMKALKDWLAATEGETSEK